MSFFDDFKGILMEIWLKSKATYCDFRLFLNEIEVCLLEEFVKDEVTVDCETILERPPGMVNIFDKYVNFK